MRLVVTGGLGYIGSVLVPKLLDAGHLVRVVDINWFGNYLKPHANLKVIEADIRKPFPIGGADAMIHLAAVANDPTGDLDPKLTWEVNALATMQLADQCVRDGVKQFIYASSGSVYGVSDRPQVTEDTPLVPISCYNSTKAVAERVLLSYQGKMAVQILRPATVCGYSPRMRLDVVVNLLTMLALEKGVIEYHGGDQIRPNIHIEDMADLYLWMLNRPKITGVFNAGFENMAVRDIANLIANKVGCQAIALPIIDPRSYRQNSDKLLQAGFKPRRTVSDAIDEIISKVSSGHLKENVMWRNILAMKEKRAA